MIRFLFISSFGLLALMIVLTSLSQGSSDAPLAENQTQDLLVSSPLSETQVKDFFLKRGCVNCHDSKNTLLGPAFHDIAERNQNDVSAKETLLKSLRQGSQGKWGELQVMPALSEQALSDIEAKAMIQWILEQNPNP